MKAQLQKVNDKDTIPTAKEAPSMSLDVMIWGRDADGCAFYQGASVRDLSERGGLLVGLKQPLATGDVIGIQYQGTSAWARVAWTAQVATGREAQSGIHLLDPHRCPWSRVLQGCAPQGIPVASERRRFPRHRVSLPIELREMDRRVHSMTHTGDVSVCGCYIESMMPSPVATKLTIQLWLDAEPIQIAGIVRTSDPGVGMGIEFVQMHPCEQQKLRNFLASTEEAKESSRD
jgi:PilZ domain-containing protein